MKAFADGMGEKNLKRIEKFCQHLLANALSQNRIMKYRSTLRTISRMTGKDFGRMRKGDVEKFLAEIEASEYTENTKRDFRVVLKVFFRWMRPDAEDPKKYPEEVRWITTSRNRRLERKVKIKECLTEDEVYKMINTSKSIRDKAIISLMFESASRIGEVFMSGSGSDETRGLKASDIDFDERGYSFTTKMGKTGEIYKRVMKKEAVSLMKKWLAQHPLKGSDKWPNVPLWVVRTESNLGFKELKDAGVRKMLKEVAAESGITKRVNPHSFRHAKITDLRINKKVSDAVIEMLVGWKPGSDMLSTYQHATKSDVDGALLKVYGADKDDIKKRAVLKTIQRMMKDKNLAKEMRDMFKEEMAEELDKLEEDSE